MNNFSLELQKIGNKNICIQFEVQKKLIPSSVFGSCNRPVTHTVCRMFLFLQQPVTTVCPAKQQDVCLLG